MLIVLPVFSSATGSVWTVLLVFAVLFAVLWAVVMLLGSWGWLCTRYPDVALSLKVIGFVLLLGVTLSHRQHKTLQPWPPSSAHQGPFPAFVPPPPDDEADPPRVLHAQFEQIKLRLAQAQQAEGRRASPIP